MFFVSYSTESGWDNPFRPGGDLSREADEIVELIKGGKPITPTPGQAPTLSILDETDHSHNFNTPNNVQQPITESPKKVSQLNVSSAPKSANGTTKNEVNTNSNVKAASLGALDVQRGTIKPDGDASQIEHVTIKKKPKCKCCVIQ